MRRHPAGAERRLAGNALPAACAAAAACWLALSASSFAPTAFVLTPPAVLLAASARVFWHCSFRWHRNSLSSNGLWWCSELAHHDAAAANTDAAEPNHSAAEPNTSAVGVNGRCVGSNDTAADEKRCAAASKPVACRRSRRSCRRYTATCRCQRAACLGFHSRVTVSQRWWRGQRLRVRRSAMQRHLRRLEKAPALIRGY